MPLLKRFSPGDLSNENEALFFFLLIVIFLIPVWILSYFPTQDGSSHLENAVLIYKLVFHHQGIIAQFYQLNESIVPNSFGHFLLAGFLAFFQPMIAYKVFLSLYVVLFPASIRYALSTISPNSKYLAVLSFPFLYNYLFHMGSYNFMFGLIFFFFLLGFWISRYPIFYRRDMFIVLGSTFLLFFSHILSVAMAIITVCFIAAWSTIVVMLKQKEFTWVASLNLLRTYFILPLCPVVPCSLLTFYFLANTHFTILPAASGWSLLKGLTDLECLISLNLHDLWFSRALNVLIFFVIVYSFVLRKQRTQRSDCFLVLAAGYLVIYFTAHERMLGQSYTLVNHRLMFFFYFGLLFWFANQKFSPVARQCIQISGSVIALAFLVTHTLDCLKICGYLEDYSSCITHIQPNKIILPICFTPQGESLEGNILSRRVGVFLHACGYLAAQKEIVNLDNYEAFSNSFPVVFRKEVNPLAQDSNWFNIESQPPCADISGYETRTKKSVDYILIWELREDELKYPCTRSILSKLQRNYDLIYISKRGLLQLYQLRRP